MVEVGAAPVFAFWGLDDHWDVGEALVVDKVGETLFADLSFADVFVAVDSTSKRPFGIVQVDAFDVGQTDDTLQFVHHGGVVLRFAEVVARRKEMTRVQAHTQSVGCRHAIDDGRKLLEAVADGGALPGRGFQENHGTEAGTPLVHLVERFGYAFDAAFDSASQMCTGMKDQRRHAQGLAALKLIDHRTDTFPACRRVR